MGFWDAVSRPFRGRAWVGTDALAGVDWVRPVIDVPPPPKTLEQRVAEATAETVARRAVAKQESLELSGAFGLDPDDGLYRRLTTGAKMQRRDLSPIQHDRMLEVTNYLWEQNPFARRLITLMTDLIVGEGVNVVADDEGIQQQIDKTWTHPSNVLGLRIREFHNFLSLTGELIIPVAVNPVTGRPSLGFIDPYQVKEIRPAENNVLMPDQVVLKAPNGIGDGPSYRVIRINPATDKLEGDCFYFKINSLPNSLRGRSDLLPLADWLDLYDQYMFAEVERLQLLSNFVWDYTVKGGDEKKIQERLARFPTPKPGTVFGHNENESLEARTPDLQAADRSEVARLLRTHIAGSFGFPLTYFGDTDSNNATIQGQNDVMMKTPAARQKEFGICIGTIAEFIVQQTTGRNPALFNRGASTSSFRVQMPEIQAKDIARVGQVLSSVVAANDTAMANGTMSRKDSIAVQVGIMQHLGVKLDAADVERRADEEREERQARADDMQAAMARSASIGRGNPPAAGGGDDGEEGSGDDEEGRGRNRPAA